MLAKLKELTMTHRSARKFRETKALVSNGMSKSEACRRTGLAKSQYWTYSKAEQKTKDVTATLPSSGSNFTQELPLEEQVIASDLSAKAKVKILSTLLNA